MSRKASIDIGTNSTRLLVAEVGQKIIPLHSAERITRLGQAVSADGCLSDAAMTRVIDALVEYRQISDAFGATEYRVLATSATRDAANREQFVQRVLRETGLQIRILTGTEEAELSFLGALHDQPNSDQALVIDIGGGSTEFLFGGQRLPSLAKSIDIGSRRLTEKYFQAQNSVQEAMRKSADHCRAELRRNFPDQPLPSLCIAVGGTATTCAMMISQTPLTQPEKIHGYLLRHQELIDLVEKLAALSIPERQELIGLHPLRADVILAGALILETILSFWQLHQVRISLADLLYGVFLQEGM